jgi:hypothetical protein
MIEVRRDYNGAYITTRDASVYCQGAPWHGFEQARGGFVVFLPILKKCMHKYIAP